MLTQPDTQPLYLLRRMFGYVLPVLDVHRMNVINLLAVILGMSFVTAHICEVSVKF